MTLPRGGRAIDMEDSAMFVAQLSVPEEVEPVIREGTSSDLGKFLRAVDRLQASIAFFDRNRHLNMCEGALRHARQLMHVAQQSLEGDFHEMLGSSSGFVDPAELREQVNMQATAEARGEPPESTASMFEFPELLFPEAVPVLQSMAKRLILMGRGPQVAKSYRDRRATALLRNLERLGVEKATPRDIQDMSWEDLDAKMRLWMENIRIVVKILLPGERRLCYEILQDVDPYRERCFADFGGGAVHYSLMLGEAVAESKKSPEKLFALLDMYDTVKEVLPKAEAMFDGPTGLPVRKACADLLKALASGSRATFDEFELAIEHNETEQSSATTQREGEGEGGRREGGADKEEE